MRTGATPLRRVWRAWYRLHARLVAVGLTLGLPKSSAYLRLPEPDFVPGLSDIDLLIVLGGSADAQESAAERLRRRATRLRASRLGRLLPLVDDPRVFGDAELREVVGSSAMTYRLGQPDSSGLSTAVGIGEGASLSRVMVLMRPGLYHTVEDWHPLSRSRARLRDPPRDAQQQRIAAWLELGFWWGVLPRACMRATGPRPADLCVKCAAESVRVWLWLARGERVASRLQALQRGLELFPEEEAALRDVLELGQSLRLWKVTGSPLDRTLPLLVRLAQRIAELIDGEALAAGLTEVRLRGGDPTGPIVAGDSWTPVSEARPAGILPLLDWRGLVSPLRPDDTFAPLSAAAEDASVYLAAAGLNRGPYPTLLADGLLIRPGAEYMRTRLRGIECRTTDPVSFAMLEQKLTASFPNLSGWCAKDVARRAVAEHRAWLDPRTIPPSAGAGRSLGMLLSAVRAAVFFRSLDGEPELPLTLADGVRALPEISLATALAAEDGLEHYIAFAHGAVEPPLAVVNDLRARLLELPVYGGG